MSCRINGTSKTSRILIAHENPLFRDCLVLALTNNGGREVVALERGDDGWMTNFSNDCPTVVVVDLSFPDERVFNLIAELRRSLDHVEIVALVANTNEREFVDALRIGPTACVPMSGELEELHAAIEHASRGEAYCSPQIASSVLARLGEVARSENWTVQDKSAVLSSRELEILRLIAKSNLSNKQIARRLNISLYTVKNHVHNILEKLLVRDRHAAARFAIKHRWF